MRTVQALLCLLIVPGAALGAGADFLRIGAGARAAAMGSAYTAVADDASAIYWNPAGLSLLDRREATLSHGQWLLGSSYDFVGYAHPLSWASLGLGITRLSQGAIDGHASDRSATGNFNAADGAYALGASIPFERARAGVSLKYVTSSIGADNASTVALDLGLMRAFENAPLTLGAAVRNIGPGLKFIDQRDPLPLTATAGAALRLVGAFRLATDLVYEPDGKRLSASVGSEYAVLPAVRLRAGYGSTAHAYTTPLAGLGGGLGLSLGRYSVDYAISPFGDLGNVQRIGLSVAFGSPDSTAQPGIDMGHPMLW